MAYAPPGHSKTQVNLAGEALIRETFWEDERRRTLAVINNWRSSHAYPLLAMRMSLTTRARKIDKKALVAQRLKRLRSIENKLTRFPAMKLSQMQDIGGCRAVLRSAAAVERLVKVHETSAAKSGTGRSQLVRKKDYIREPKTDGYRGVHLVYRYRTTSERYKPWEGLSIELQLRSKLQHAWATAVETVDVFTGQALKFSGGRADWRRFFALVSSAIARRERRPEVPGTSSDHAVLLEELRSLTNLLRVHDTLRGLRIAVKQAAETKGAKLFLLFLDTSLRLLEVLPFMPGEEAEASRLYLSLEEGIVDKTTQQAVLVSLESLRALPKAYPNFYLDTDAFLRALDQALLGDRK